MRLTHLDCRSHGCGSYEVDLFASSLPNERSRILQTDGCVGGIIFLQEAVAGSVSRPACCLTRRHVTMFGGSAEHEVWV